MNWLTEQKLGEIESRYKKPWPESICVCDHSSVPNTELLPIFFESTPEPKAAFLHTCQECWDNFPEYFKIKFRLEEGFHFASSN